jgi:general secretion pathway protein A
MNGKVFTFFGLSHMPFTKKLDIKNIYKNSTINDAYACLAYGIYDEDIILFTGPAGSGKSVVLRALIDSFDSAKYMPGFLRGANMNDTALYKAVLECLRIDSPYFKRDLKIFFYKTIPELNKKPVIIIDDAHDLEDNALCAITAMSNFDCDSKNIITFILCGHNELRERIKYSTFKALKQRIRISVKMNGLNLEETCKYIDHQTKLCSNLNPIYSDDAKSKIFARSKGNPRLVNMICYQSLIKAAADEYKIIDSNNLVFDEFIDD